MTQAVTPELLAVTQADREAAAKLSRPIILSLGGDLHEGFAGRVREGIWDHHWLVQAFARHRLASASAPAGWRMVPVEPTERMLVEGFGYSDLIVCEETHEWRAEMRIAWSAMLTAVPQPPVVGCDCAARFYGDDRNAHQLSCAALATQPAERN